MTFFGQRNFGRCDLLFHEKALRISVWFKIVSFSPLHLQSWKFYVR